MTEEATTAGRRVAQQVIDALAKDMRVDVIIAGLAEPIRVKAAELNHLVVEMESSNGTFHFQTAAVIGAHVRGPASSAPAYDDIEDEGRVSA